MSLFKKKKEEDNTPSMSIPPPQIPMSIPQLQQINFNTPPMSKPGINTDINMSIPPPPKQIDFLETPKISFDSAMLKPPPPLPSPPIPSPMEIDVPKQTGVIQAIKDYFEPAPEVRARDIVRELPGAAAEVGHSILQGISRNLASAAKTFSGSYGPSQAKTPIGKFFLGEEPIYNVGERAVQLSKDLQSGKYAGVKLPGLVSLPLAAGLVTTDVALDIPGVNLPIGEEKKVTKPVIENADELTSIIAKEFKKEAGDSVRMPLRDLIKHLSNKFEISDNLLDELDKGPLVGDNFSIEKAGKFVEFIFDEGFKPIKNVIEKLKTPAPVIKEVAEQPVKNLSTGTGVFMGGRELTPEEVAKIRQEEEAVANEMKTFDPLAEKFGRYADDVREMIGKVRRFGESVNKKTGELYREHIPRSKSLDVSSDEIAADLGMSESELMSEINRLAESKQSFKKLKEPIEKTVENISRPMSEAEFNALNREADRFLKEQYGLITPSQYSKKEIKAVAENERANLRLLKEADKAFSENLISAEGKGGIRVPFSEIDITKWKDKDMLLFNRETPLRNIEEVAGKDAPTIRKFFFDRVAEETQKLENFAKSIKKNVLEDKIINKLGITPGSKYDELVMDYGEKKITLDELKQLAPDKWQNIVEADKEFRKLYDFLFDKINETITKYGYDPIQKRKDYYTHYQEVGNLFTQLGVITKSGKLPADINGLTADFRPGKQFFRFAQPRLGGEYTKSAIGAFESYLYPAARQIYYTDVIQRGRALWNTLSEAIQKNENLPPTHLSNFMAWLNDYVNTLAGKKSLMARGTEGLLGRTAYEVVDKIAKQTSANLVAGNISASLTNSIPLTQAAATTDKKAFIKGLINAVLNPLTEENDYTIDGIQSSFLRRRFPYREISQTLWENVGEKAGWLFNTIDKFTSNVVVAAKYFERLAKGDAPEEAMKFADEYAARLIGDRSWGQMPTLFNNQGLLKLATMFQLEVNNQLSFIFKDAPRYAGSEGSKLKTAATLAEIAIYSHLFNNIFEWATGRRPAFDPIYIALKSYDIWANQEGSINEKAGKTVSTIADNLPFGMILAGEGKIPILAGIPKPQDIAESPIKSALKFGLTYLPPAGGYQMYKTLEGLTTYAKGYSETPGGRIRFPVEKDLLNLVRSALFGEYSTPEANKYYEGGETALGEKQSKIFKLFQEQSPELAKKYYDYVHLERDYGDLINNFKKYGEELSPKLQSTDEAVRQKAYEDLNKKAQETQKKIVELLSKTPQTKGIIDIVLGKFGEFIKQIIGFVGGKEVKAEEVDNLKQPQKQKTQSPSPSPYPGLKPILEGGSGPYEGISKIVSEALATSGGVGKIKKGALKKWTPKKVGLTIPKTKILSPTSTFQIKPISPPPKIKLGEGRERKRSGVKLSKIKLKSKLG